MLCRSNYFESIEGVNLMKRVAYWTIGTVACYLAFKSLPDIVRYVKISRM
jgi:hypothetical protein